MKKTKKDLRVEIVKTLEGKKNFKVYWADATNKSVEVEANSKEEVERMFFDGNFPWQDVEEGDINFIDNSFEIEEVIK